MDQEPEYSEDAAATNDNSGSTSIKNENVNNSFTPAVVSDSGDSKRTLTAEFKAEAEETFMMITGDGNIETSTFPVEKLDVALRAMGLNPRLPELLQFIDENGIKRIDLELFFQIVLICQMDSNFAIAEMRETFEVFDRNNDATADISEFKRVLTKLSELLSDRELEEQVLNGLSREVGAGDTLSMSFEEMVAMIRSVDGRDFGLEVDDDARPS
jgi:Ca2+-binding EF-hand superfamily protein